MLKFCRNADYDVFRDICLPVAGLFEGKFSGLGELFMGFTKMCSKRNPRFLNRRKKIPGLDRLLVFYCLVKDVICLGDYLRV